MKEGKQSRSQVAAENRKLLIGMVMQTLKEAKELNREVDDEKLIANMMFNAGLSRRTAIEYLKAAKNLI